MLFEKHLAIVTVYVFTVFFSLFLYFAISAALKRIVPTSFLNMLDNWLEDMHELFEDIGMKVRAYFYCLPIDVKNRNGDRSLEHLTEQQWRKHAVAYAEFIHGVGKYRSSEKGMKGFTAWFEAEGLSPSPYLESLKEQSKSASIK